MTAGCAHDTIDADIEMGPACSTIRLSRGTRHPDEAEGAPPRGITVYNLRCAACGKALTKRDVGARFEAGGDLYHPRFHVAYATQAELEVEIRPARPEDYEGVCRLMDGVDELHRERLPWLFQRPSAQPRTEAYFNDLLSREDSAVFVADAGTLAGAVVGLLRAAPEFPVFIQQRWGVLDGLVVDPAFRRRGLGKQLARAVEAWAARAGAPWVELNVYDFNAEARSFYEGLGYLAVSTKMRRPGG